MLQSVMPSHIIQPDNLFLELHAQTDSNTTISKNKL
jgi:hypothetical protein